MTGAAAPGWPFRPGQRSANVLRHLATIGLARTAIAIVVLQLAVVVAVGGLAAQLGPREPFKGDWEELAVPGNDVVSAAIAPLERWDSLWYQHIARAGYGADDGTAAFLPLYPAVGSLVSRLVFGNVGLALVLVACVSYAVALWLLGRLAIHEWSLVRPAAAATDTRSDGDARTFAIVTMLGLATFPTAFFFVAPFTESLFLALALAAMLFARQGRLGAAALAAGLATLVRTQGLFLALPIAWEGLRSAGLLGVPIQRPNAAALQAAARGVVAAAVPVVVLFGWYGAMSVFVGAEMVGLSAQAPWGYVLTAPWDALLQSAAYVTDHLPRPLGLIEALNLACLLGFTGLAVVARRLPVSHTLYTIPSLALVASRVMWFMPLMSVSRYVLVVFPGFLGLGMLLQRHPRVAVGWLILASLAQVVLVQWFARWGFVA